VDSVVEVEVHLSLVEVEVDTLVVQVLMELLILYQTVVEVVDLS
jgi:hypothetical protein